MESLPKNQRKSDGIPFKVFPSLVYLFLTSTTFFCIIAKDHLKIVVYQFELVGSNPNILSIFLCDILGVLNKKTCDFSLFTSKHEAFEKMDKFFLKDQDS